MVVFRNGPCTRFKGFSLVELMIALVLGLLLTAGLIQLFSGTRLTFRTNDALARVQENGRFALELLKRDLRTAGTHGFCAGRIEIRNHLDTACTNGSVDLFNASRTLTGWEYDGTAPDDDYTIPNALDPTSTSLSDWSSSATTGALPSLLANRVVPGSDVLVVRRVDVVPNLTAAGVTPENANAIPLSRNHGLGDDAIVMVTNCATGADLFQNRSNANASALSAGSGSCSNPGPGNRNSNCLEGGRTVSCDWSTEYDENMQMFSVTVVAYYIGTNPNTGQPGLYRLNMLNGTSAAQPQELIEGAENMQVLYGFSDAAPTGDGQSVDAWETAASVPAGGWEQVIALRLALGVRSPETADTDRTAVTLDLSETNVTAPADGRLRQPFSATIALRNRVIVI